MKSELIVDVQPDEVSTALLEDGRLVSLQKEARNIAYAVGDIYLAKVKKLMPGLNAAFVNVGYEKDAFLHYLDLGPNFASYEQFLKELLDENKKPRLSQMKLLPEIDKHGSVADTLQPGKHLLVQIVKEPISSKGPRLTTEISFTGRYLVLTPFCDKISVSQKIKSSEERTRLRQLVESIKPRNFGVIIRTSAEGKRVAELNHELKTLVQSFEDACAKAQKSQAPALVFEEESRIVGMLRDVFSTSFEAIHVNDADICQQLKTYVSIIAPEKAEIVTLYDKDEPIFDKFSVTRQIKSSFGKTVSFKSGAYIIIEHTEALHVIDVNSGNRTKASNDQESNALEVNLRAADEIARQLRLRDMGGIIVVDFIDMAKSEHRQQLFDHMREIMANDRARHNILPLSKFGLMQITRQRVRPALDIATAEQCPSCFGKGEVQPSILFTDRLFEKLEYLVTEKEIKDFIMYVHPYVDAYIKKGFFFNSLYFAWRRKLGRSFKILPDESLAYLEYKVIDKDRNVLHLHEEKDLNRSSVSKTENKVKNRGGEEPESTTDQQPKSPKKKPEQLPAPQQKPKADIKEESQPEKKTETTADAAQTPKARRKAQSKRQKAENVSDTPIVEPVEIAKPQNDSDIQLADKPKEAKPRKKTRKKQSESRPAKSGDVIAETPVALIPENFCDENLPAAIAETATAVDSVKQPDSEPKKPKRKPRRKPAEKKESPAKDTPGENQD